MGEVNKILGIHGAGIQVEALGRTWIFSPLTQGMKAEMEAWLESRARQKIIEAKPHLSEEDYQQRSELVEENIAAGLFGWGSKAMNKALHGGVASYAGTFRLIQTLLRPRHPDIDFETIEKICTANAQAVGAAVRDSLGIVGPKDAGDQPPDSSTATNGTSTTPMN